ncbi:hypothetical protein NQ315_015565 [Exocentrus adspersus]|uniref:UDP-glucuronosyltransferase n=1 Tax=Exocentrus adspersus TaxID=1586481 RepID=A0AAV8V9D7_9CUCU|nr:hypothetical protein NQ315_015565 [Exocentrus adspersus]
MKILIFYVLVLTLLYSVRNSHGARILASIFSPSYSHQVTFRPLWKELAKRGHEIILLTTDPMEDPELTNVKEIDLKESYAVMDQYGASELVSNQQGKSYRELFSAYIFALSRTADWQLSHPEVQQLIRNTSEHFDLLMVEMMFPTHLAFVDRFSVPFIGLCSLDAVPRVHKSIGNFMHPIIYPDYLFPFTKNLTFVQRVISFIVTAILDIHSYFMYSTEDETVTKHFGSNIRPLKEIEKDTSMLFINVNPIFHQLRPMGPNTIQIGGGTHLRQAQPLPQDIEEFLDTAKTGVIYFSLGTNVKASLISDELRNVILNTFANLPYKILWKFEQDLPGTPDNVKIMKWVPQQDLLQHPNVVLFITQCGLQSMEESIFNHVPMVGMPFYGDQSRNAKIMEENGLGLVVDRKNLIKDDFYRAIMEVINKPIYREKVEEIAILTNDVEMTGLEKAVWWTEYTIRTRGAKHLRNPMVDLPFYKVYLLDVLGFLLSIVLISLYVVRKIVKILLKVLCSKTHEKKKIE